MKIIENPRVWNKFLTEIKRGRKESETDYLQRVKNCLIAFHDENSLDERKFLDNSQLFRIYGDFPSTDLTGFVSEYLEYKYFRIRQPFIGNPNYFKPFEGSVRLYVEKDRAAEFQEKTGIVSFVGNIIDGKENQRKQDLEFIKKLWKQFNYKF